MKKALVYSKHKTARTSVKKTAPILDLIRGRSAYDAKRILTFSRTKSAGLVLKVLKSAVANARNNLNLSEKDLYVSDTYANEGRTMKKGRFVSRANHTIILKRTAHLVIGLSERSK